MLSSKYNYNTSVNQYEYIKENKDYKYNSNQKVIKQVEVKRTKGIIESIKGSNQVGNTSQSGGILNTIKNTVKNLISKITNKIKSLFRK